MRISKNNLLSLALGVGCFFPMTGQTKSKLWKEFDKKDGVGTVLPDFSYAGYAFCEKEIPTPEWPVFDVTNFGAVPNDGKSDKQALIKAIEAVKKNGKGIVSFPKGRFLINEDTDEKNPIKITCGKIIFRGAGSQKGGTEIFMKNHMQKEGQSDRIAGKYGNKRMRGLPHFFQVDGYQKKTEKKLTVITKDATKGSRTVMVEKGDKLKKGQWVQLECANKDPKVIAEALGPLTFDPKWKQMASIGYTIREIHKIESIKGQKVTFHSPLRFDLKAHWQFHLKSYSFIDHVGIENLAFVGNFKEKFNHHGSAIQDGGWKFWELSHVVDSWVRDCRFKDVSGVVGMKNSAASTMMNILVEGNGGHTSVRTQGSTGVLVAFVEDKASQWHAPGVAKPASGSVFYRVKYNPDRCWESHATQPRATLFDCVEGGFDTGYAGGAVSSMPNHLNDLVLWNFKEIDQGSKDFEFVKKDSKFWKFYPPIIVGFHGANTTFHKEDLAQIESLGKKVQPESLFEVQLEKRMGKLPKWLEEAKREWFKK